MTRFLEKSRSFYASKYYPILVWLLVFLGHSTQHDLIFGGIMMLSLVFGLWINHDIKFTIMPLLTTFFIIPIGEFKTTDPGYDRYLEPHAFIPLMSLAALVGGSIVYFVIKNRKIANPIPVRGVFLSILILCGALCLNGIFSPNYTLGNLFFTVFLILAMPIEYMLFAAFLQHDKSATNYFMNCLVGVGLLICAELIFAYFTTVAFDAAGNIIKTSVVLGWGIWTNIGSMLVFLMPACFYFAANFRHGWVAYGLGLFHYLCILLSQSRAALLIGTLSLLLCLIYICITGKNKKQNRIFTAILAGCAVLVVLLFSDKLIALVQNFLNQGLDDNGRYKKWISAIDAFLRAPVFGSGFYDVCNYATEEGWSTFGMPQMCHNTVLQFLGASGVIGIGAYVYHRFETVRLAVRRPNPTKIFASICILGFLLFGLLDVVFFIGYPNMFYTLLLLFMQFSERPDDLPQKTYLN